MGKHTHWMLTVGDESKPPFSVLLACGDKVVVGRSRICEIMLEDHSVSRKHCFLGVDGEGVLRLTDLGARHPPTVDGTAVGVGGSVAVADGARIRLGGESFIQAECLGEKPSSKADCAGSAADAETGEVHTEVLGDAEPCGTAEADPDHADGTQELPEMPTGGSNQQDDTRLVDAPRSRGQQSESEPGPAKTGGEDAASKNKEPADDGATNPAPENSLPQPVEEKGGQPAPVDKASQGNTQVLGQTLRGKLLQPKKGRPKAAQSNADRSGATEGAQAAGDAQDETNYIDPAELRKLMKGKAGSRRLKKGGAAAPRAGNEAGEADAGDAQDETNYIDPAELRKLMKGKGKAPGSRKGRLR